MDTNTKIANIDEDGYYLLSDGTTRTHFKKIEMMCSCGCGEIRMGQNIINAVEQFRLKIDSAVIVARGVSCTAQNEKAGGAPKSEHLPIGSAVDITVNGQSEEDMFRQGLDIFNRIGLYCRKGNLHVDMKVGDSLYWFRKMRKKIDDKGNEIWVSDKYEYYTDALKCLEDYTNFKVEIISNGYNY